MQLQLLEEQNDERYMRYHLIEEFRIFNVEIDKEVFEILIAYGQELEKLLPNVKMYMEWLNN